MFKRRLSVLAAALGLMAILLPFTAAGVAASTTVVVKPSTLKGACQTVAVPFACYTQYPTGWLYYNDENDSGDPSLGSFVTGPASPPSGTGSAQISVTGSERRNLATYAFAGTALAAITVLSFRTYNPSAGNGGSALRSGYLQFNVDFDGSDSWQKRLIYVPSANGTVTPNNWNSWDAIASGAARWLYSGTTWPGGAIPGTTAKTWAQVLLDYPTARIRVTDAQLSIRVGEPYADGYTENIDSLTFATAAATTTYDFEPETACTSVCYVNGATGSDSFGGDTPTSAKKTIQAAINQVNANGQVRVLPGTYDEAAPGSAPTSIGGTYQFGLFFGSAKPGITLLGVTASDVPIVNAAATLATINTDATNNFGTSGIFVEAANTTIQGVTVGPNAAGDNKTIEVVADNFTLKDSVIAVPGGGAVYISEFDAPAGPVSTYHILDNRFLDATQIAISSGAGLAGPASGREIKGNTFALGGETWPAISFNGSGGVPWFTKQVGGATITGNSFSAGGRQYIRARGSYIEAQFDWKSFWDGNTYDKGTAALVTTAPFDVRSFSYVSGPYSFTNVRRIGATIQGEVDNAVASDTVLVKAGSYNEDVTIGKPNLKLLGAGIDVSTIVGPMTGAGTTLEISAGGAGTTVDGFTVTRAGNNTTDWNTTVKNQGVAIYGTGSTLQNSKITGNRNGVFLYGATNVTIKNNTIDNNRTGIHLVNDVTGLVVRNNFITNNWTMGILFRDESSPNPTGAVTIQDNNISGNWYSQVEARSLFSAPALNVENNWLGTTAPTVLVAPSSGEPGYASQIPLAYGGAAAPPATSPTIVYNGLNLTNPVDYIPFRCSGVDASPAIGFQPVAGTSPCYTFSGFFQPVDNLPAENVVKAGRAIPVKFSLGGDQGLNIFAAGYPTSIVIPCGVAATDATVETTVAAASSSLSYDASTDTYTYLWKTDKAWANTCRQLVMKLSDGSQHIANFKFKK